MLHSDVNIYPYIFWRNNESYEVDGDTFASLSKKFPAIRKEYPNQYIFEDNYDKSVFEAFISACQLKPFDLTPNNAYELLDLAEEWKVPTLKMQIESYIEKHHIEKKVKQDYLGILLEHVDNDCDTYEDWKNIADDIDQALRDKRFSRVPPEVIFQILAIADKKKPVNKMALIDFVMNLYKSNPANAVPLILRLDFTQMSREQIEFIFKSKDTHEENISYFIASSLSALDNKVRHMISKAEKSREVELTVLKNNIRRARNATLEKKAEQYRNNVESRRSEIDRQQKLIDDLEEQILKHRDRVVAEERKVRARRTPIAPDALEKINNDINNEVKRMEADAEKQLHSFQDKVNKMQLESPRTAKNYFNEAVSKGTSETDRVQTTLKGLIELIDKTEKEYETSADLAERLQASFAAKVLRDKLRYDSFLRRLTNRFKVFERNTSLGAKPSRIKVADEEIRLIESRIDRICPIRQPAQISPPVSPLKSPLKPPMRDQSPSSNGEQ